MDNDNYYTSAETDDVYKYISSVVEKWFDTWNYDERRRKQKCDCINERQEAW